jgi:hypothetical protein
MSAIAPLIVAVGTSARLASGGWGYDDDDDDDGYYGYSGASYLFSPYYRTEEEEESLLEAVQRKIAREKAEYRKAHPPKKIHVIVPEYMSKAWSKIKKAIEFLLYK